MSKLIDLTGKRYGKLIVLDIYKNKNQRTKWVCLCECGNEKIILGDSLKSGKTRSCGCLRFNVGKTNKKHGKTNTRLFTIWNDMKQRCSNPKQPSYKNYGGRDIKVCNEWLNNFQNFYNWAISNGYNENLSIDRIDVNGDYEPSNCRWATSRKQGNNKRTNRIVFYKGKKYTISELSELIKIPYATLLWRINHNWDEEDLNMKTNLNNSNIRRNKHE